MVSEGYINKIIGVLIGVVVLFLLASELVPEAQTAGDTLNATGVPLGSLFTSSGVVFVIIMAAILMAVYRGVSSKGK